MNPAERPGSHGLRVGPKARGSVVGRSPNSGVADLATKINPAFSEGVDIGILPGGGWRVAGGGRQGRGRAAALAGYGADNVAQVLHEEWHTRERSRLAAGPPRGARPVEHRRHHEVQLRIERLDLADRVIDELRRRGAAPPHQVGHGETVEIRGLWRRLGLGAPGQTQARRAGVNGDLASGRGLQVLLLV
jgi:hypothetical protein